MPERTGVAGGADGVIRTGTPSSSTGEEHRPGAAANRLVTSMQELDDRRSLSPVEHGTAEDNNAAPSQERRLAKTSRARQPGALGKIVADRERAGQA